jgi:tight adherence protein B
MKILDREALIRLMLVGLSAFLIAFSVTRTFVIAGALMSVVVILFVISTKRASTKQTWELFQIVPEIIDHIISGIQSGLSLNESIVNLGSRGPRISHKYFLEFESHLHDGRSFEDAISHLQNRFSIRAADQLFESLIFAKSLGGSELLSLLRQLGDFTRQDLALRREIAAKQSWIRNSAHLSAAAPWILLLLLSAQPTTAAAFTGH